MKIADAEKLAEQALRDALEGVRFVTDVVIETPPDRDRGTDFVARLRLGQTEYRLVCQVSANGQPRAVRTGVDQLRLLLRQEEPDVYAIVLAPFLSERSASICKEAGVGYIDFAGNCMLDFGTVHIRERGRDNPFKSNRKLKSIYQAKSSRVLRVLLSAPSRRWRVEPLSAEADVSLGLVSEVRRELLDREWADTDDDGLFLTAPESLLTDWVRNYDMGKHDSFACYSPGSVSELEVRLAQTCADHQLRYALAAFSAGARLAPNVRYNRVLAFVQGDALSIAEELAANRVASGANLLLYVPFDAGVFYDSRTVDGQCVTSPIQTYLDLRQQRGRGDEAADAVLERVIRPQW